MKIINTVEQLDLDATLKEASNIKRWTTINFGKYEGLTIPELVFSDPGYFYWALSSDCFTRQLRLEADVAADRLQHMKMPRSISVPSVFVIRLKYGMFEDFSIKKGRVREVKKNSRGIVTCHLDFSLISRPNFATDVPRAKMLERVKYHFFEKDADTLRRRDFRGFLGDPDNFATRCRRKHVPEVLRWDNPLVMSETENQSSERHDIPDHIVERIDAANFRDMLVKRHLDPRRLAT